MDKFASNAFAPRGALALMDAADALEMLAAGGVPERSDLLSATRALNTYARQSGANGDVNDAVVELGIFAAGAKLDGMARARAAFLAAALRTQARS
jgi:hypothetical protein